MSRYMKRPRQRLQERGNGWNNVAPRTKMASRDLGYVGSERPLTKRIVPRAHRPA
jgi:hypothetical protein